MTKEKAWLIAKGLAALAVATAALVGLPAVIPEEALAAGLAALLELGGQVWSGW